jgi:CDP-paratose synthetase
MTYLARMSRSILVTGGTGFLGSRLVRALVARGDQVTVLKRSFSNTHRLTEVSQDVRYFDLDRVNLEQVFADSGFDSVIHCATDYGRKDVPAHAVIEANLVLPLRLLDLAKSNGVRAFVNTDTILDKRVSHYSLSKRQFSDWLRSFSSHLVGINIALEHFYGPGDDHSKFVSNMAWSLVNDHERIHLTKGEQRRDFIYIDDVIRAMLVVLDHSLTLSSGYYRYEVGTGNAISIRDFMTLLKRLAANTRTELNWGAVPYRENETMDSVVDISALSSLGWSPQVSLEQGLANTLAHTRTELRPA